MRLSKLENLSWSFQVNRISVQCLAKLRVLVKNPINRVAVAKEDQNRVCIQVHHTSWCKRPKVKGNVAPREMLGTADENGALGRTGRLLERRISANLFAVSSYDWKYVIKMLVSFSFKRVPCPCHHCYPDIVLLIHVVFCASPPRYSLRSTRFCYRSTETENEVEQTAQREMANTTSFPPARWAESHSSKPNDR